MPMDANNRDINIILEMLQGESYKKIPDICNEKYLTYTANIGKQGVQKNNPPPKKKFLWDSLLNV